MVAFAPVKHAIDIFLQIKGEVGGDEELGSDVRARAREVPELMESCGLIPALSFCYAKAKEEGRGRSYKLYLKAVLTYLKEIGLMESDVDDALNNPAETLNELYSKAFIALPLLRPFLVEFKRLCEATWESKR